MDNQRVETFFAAQSAFTITTLMIFLLLGFVAIGFGIFMRLRPLAFSGKSWYAELIAWNIIDISDNKPRLVEDVIRCWSRVQSSSLIGLGSAVILDMLATIGIAFATTGRIDSEFLSAGRIFFASFYFCMVMGSGIGFTIGMWQVRVTAKYGTIYGDLYKRQVSDYRSNGFRILSITLILYIVVATFIFAPHLSSLILIQDFGDSLTLSLPNNALTLVLLPLTMLFVLIMVEILMVRITNLSRFRVTYDPVAGQHADDMLRSTIIGMLQGYEFVIISLLSFVQWDVIERNLWLAHFWYVGNRPFSFLLDSILFLTVLIQLSGFLISILRGRLGGRISYWPWKRQISKG